MRAHFLQYIRLLLLGNNPELKSKHEYNSYCTRPAIIDVPIILTLVKPQFGLYNNAIEKTFDRPFTPHLPMFTNSKFKCWKWPFKRCFGMFLYNIVVIPLQHIATRICCVWIKRGGGTSNNLECLIKDHCSLSS